MSQHDLDIANASGASVRSDLNNALQALGSRQSGSSAPSTTYAHMLWVDTTNGVLKRRNAANSGWLLVDTIDETFVLSRSSNTILDVSDKYKTVRATGSYTQTFDAAATLGDGWEIGVRVESSVTLTLDPNSTETIDGSTTLAVVGPASFKVVCNGSALYTVGLNATLNGTETLANKTVASPVLSGTATGTYSLGGTPTLAADLAIGSSNRIFTSSGTTAGSVAWQIQDGTTRTLIAVYQGVDTTGFNAANTALGVRQAGGTGRSINAAGTVNASGADYAEYETKADGCGDIEKGAIVGFAVDGLLTDKWADAVTFGVKSSAPSYVGGDTWGRGLSGAELEAARQKVDRIAYAGKVPVNVMGATPGQWIEAAQDGAGIKGVAVASQGPNAVGRVRRVLPDGRAEIKVL